MLCKSDWFNLDGVVQTAKQQKPEMRVLAHFSQIHKKLVFVIEPKNSEELKS